MAGTNALDLHALAEELLDASVDALDTIPTFDPGLAGAPDRTFVPPGLPALDCCDQLTVHVVAVNESPPGQSNTHKTGSRRNIVTLVVTTTRCYDLPKDGSTPTEAQLSGTAEQLNADGWALWNYLWNLMRSGELLTLCDEVFWDGLRSLTPSGGCGGWVLTLRAAYEGYESP
jgi:hypothetical protein